jgi:glycerol dehydrogenase-like iron-containing ADH family enzyme
MKSKGIGDTIAKITAATGIKQVVEKVSKSTGKECGCKKRQEKLNNPNLLINKTFYNN